MTRNSVSSLQKLLAGRRLVGGRFGHARRSAVGRVAEGHLAAGRPLGRAAVAAHEVGRVVGQNLPQPGQPLLLAVPVEPVEIAVGLQHRLLHQVRGVDLPPQPGFDLRSGDKAQIRTAQGEEPVAALGVPLPGPFDQHGKDGRLAVAHEGLVYHGPPQPTIEKPPRRPGDDCLSSGRGL